MTKFISKYSIKNIKEIVAITYIDGRGGWKVAMVVGVGSGGRMGSCGVFNCGFMGFKVGLWWDWGMSLEFKQG